MAGSTGDSKKTSPQEAALILILLVIGITFMVKPAAVSLDLFVEWVQAFPDPATLGDGGVVGSGLALGAGIVGALRALFRRFR